MTVPSETTRVALVTGASRGIGRASALALAAAGAQVLVHYGRGATEADDVVAEIRKARTVCGKASRTVLRGRRAMKRTSHRYSCDFRY